MQVTVIRWQCDFHSLSIHTKKGFRCTLAGPPGGLADTRGAVVGTCISVFLFITYCCYSVYVPLRIFTHTASRLPFKRPLYAVLYVSESVH